MIEYKAGRKMVIGICDDDKKWRESCKITLIGFSGGHVFFNGRRTLRI